MRPKIKPEMPKSLAIAGTMAEIEATLNAMQNPCRHNMKKSMRLMPLSYRFISRLRAR
jgi:hypothetical protein